MLRSIFSLIFSTLLSYFLCGQPNLVSETRQVFNPDVGHWQNVAKEVYEYYPASRNLKTWKTLHWSTKQQKYANGTAKHYHENGSPALELNYRNLDELYPLISDSIIYQYTSEGKLAEKNKISTPNGNFKNREKEMYIYDEQNRLVEFSLFQNSNTSDFDLVRLENYEYSSNGCLARNYVENYQTFVDRQETTTFFTYDDDCVLIKEEITDKYFSDFSSDFMREFRILHFKIENGEYRIDSSLHFKNTETTNGEFEYYLTEVTEYDDFGRIIRDKDVFSEVTGRGYLYFYDDKNNLIRQEDWSIHHETMEWYSPIIRAYDFEYDDNDFLIKMDFYQYGTLLEETIYQNFCDGLPKSIQVRDPNLSGSLFSNNKRTLLEYDKGADCEIVDNEESLQIYPNPVHNLFVITSDLLLLGNSDLTIYNSAGQLEFHLKNLPRSERFELDVQNLQPGLYFLTLENTGRLEKRQLVKI